jgi:hypothetical protein
LATPPSELERRTVARSKPAPRAMRLAEQYDNPTNQPQPFGMMACMRVPRNWGKIRAAPDMNGKLSLIARTFGNQWRNGDVDPV